MPRSGKTAQTNCCSCRPRARACLDPGDRLFHSGGDSFAVVSENLAREADAVPLATRLLAALGEHCRIAGQPLTATASIGIGLAPDGGADAATLLATAQAALRAAKLQGGNRAQFSTAELAEKSRAYAAREAALHVAVAQQWLELHYQPQFDCRSGALIGFEALARWYHPEHGLASIGPYIDVAETSGLIQPLGEWALAQACRDAAAWPTRDGRALQVAVNVSPRQLERADFVDQVRHALRRSGLPASRLELELTESSVHSQPVIAAVLAELAALGVGIALDDFGVGWSSLASLRRLPVKRVKIDRSFIEGIPVSRDDVRLVQAIVTLSHGLGQRVMAEGIETAAQWQSLAQLGCDEGQGFLLGAPLPGAEVAPWIAAQAHRGLVPCWA